MTSVFCNFAVERLKKTAGYSCSASPPFKTVFMEVTDESFIFNILEPHLSITVFSI